MSDPQPSVDRDFLRQILVDLVRTNSVNPEFSEGTTNESAVAGLVAGILRDSGLETELLDAAPGRTSVVGRLPGSGGGRSLMLYAHLDTVGTEGMADPFSGEIRSDRLYGRGAYDMKGSLAACLAAARSLASGPPLAGDLLVVGVADEEVASIGMTHVLERYRTDAAIVTEPTELALCVAHKGFCWIDVEVSGRAAHGSRFQDGVDANLRMGLFLAELARLERDLRARPAHPLCGPPSLHVGTLAGGTGASTYAARSRARIERRMLPAETESAVLDEIRAVAERVSPADKDFFAEISAALTRPGFEAPVGSEIAEITASAAAQVLGAPPERTGLAYWMDAALAAQEGIDTVVIGPAGSGAHAAEEWVDLGSVERLAGILARAAARYCGGR